MAEGDQSFQSNEEFLKEMQRRRQADTPATLPQETNYEALVAQRTTLSSTEEPGGLAGLLLRFGVVKNKQQANWVLLGVFVGIVLLIVYINFF